MLSFEATALIDATPAQVWPVLTDLAAWPEWDSGVVRVSGSLALGQKLRIVVEGKPGRGYPVKVTALEPGTRMVLTGAMPFGLFTGERVYSLGRKGNSTRFTVREDYRGPLAWLVTQSIPSLSDAFRQFADGLKARVESTLQG